MTDSRREEILDIVKKEFIGPDPIDWEGYSQPNGEEILMFDSPRSRYLAGALYPQEMPEEETSIVNEDEVSENQMDTDDNESDDSQSPKLNSTKEYLEETEELINRSNAYRQSAMSITVAVSEGDCISVEVSAGHYTTIPVKDDNSKKVSSQYPRTGICWNNNGVPLSLPSVKDKIKKICIEDTNLKFDITYRYQQGNSFIYTFTLENSIIRPATFKDDDCYFQVEFCIKSELGFCPLPTNRHINVEDEDYLSNQLLYRDVKNYAIGHGCATDWDDSSAKVSWVRTAVFPTYEVKPIIPSVIEGVALNMLDYGPGSDFKNMIHELDLLCNKYSEWIESLKKEAISLNIEYRETAEYHIKNCQKCLTRMREGIKLLESNDQVKIAFQYMNLAMIMQQLHYNLPLQKWEYNSEGKLFLNNEVSVMPDPYNSDTWYGEKTRYGKWRPFQLAFVLINLKSILYKDCNERNIVDLIWFPTGGGKTEAYLGLSAYTIFLRRLLNQDDSGTAILMRYTLRLLTAQQYERASAMICACDQIRKEHEDLFGQSRITIGLWVGTTTTPNKMSKAISQFDDLYRGKSDENPFVILKCPWCGAQMGVVQHNGGARNIMGYSKKVEAHGKKKIIFKCSNNNCAFSDKETPLPLFVIDEAIYEETPTLLLGTVDKFAMLPFTPQAQTLFGFQDGEKVTAPDLIIQDELHLISGPLGSMVGHYETMINELCSLTLESKTVYPKIIASTATISRAKDQCHALYGTKPEDVFQFPPSGLSYKDSFFAHEDNNQNGRKYVGILALGSSSDATTSIRLYSALLYAVKELNVGMEAERDPYWTNIGYYNSIRELGQARSWIRADIDQYLDSIYKRKKYDKKYEKDTYRNKRRYIRRDEELTSRIPGDKVTASLANLNILYTGEDSLHRYTDDLPIDICLATNMISVGLDVPRLGLMTVAGQPKTTSEYIQATSRVGRNADDAPGIIFVLYRPGRPRDKSHYEHFKQYHSKLYCNVEPTSITPFSAPVRERALHAIMIGMMRLKGNESYNSSPPTIPNEEVLNHIEQVICKRIEGIDPCELEETMKRYQERLEDWQAWHPALWEPKRNKDQSFTDEVPLMYGAGEHPNEAWGEHGFETPTSMRSVDLSCEAKVMLHEYKAKEV